MTNETNFTRSELRSKTEMEVEAKLIHPKAVARLNEFTDLWEIVIPTGFVDSPTLGDQFKGTPAWDASQEPESSYGDSLSRWAVKNGHSGESFEDVANIFNTSIEVRKQNLRLADAYLAERNLKPFEEMTADELDSLSDEDHNQYKEAFKIIGW